MELDKIIPLQETPKTPYQTSIAVPILRFRWIHAQSFSLSCPAEKFDDRPFFSAESKGMEGSLHTGF